MATGLSLSSLSLDDSYVMVAAVDFGTTYSGYAFSFKTDPKDIKMNKNWGQNVSFQSYKTPTCVLVNSSGEFVAFGYEAEDKYAEVTEGNDSDDDDNKAHQVGEQYHLYRHFKMMLHRSQKITRNSTISSVDGQITPALDIFVMALRYLKDHLIAAVAQITSSKVDESLFRWVITVPAIWREDAKQFMREAAYKAGFITNKDSRKLIIALEPEAASIFCRGLDINHFLGDPAQAKKTSFKTGCRYLVIDAGGGTIDLTAHEVLLTGKVKEVHRASGGDWGGTNVDNNFAKLLGEVLGQNFIHLFQQQCPMQWFRFMINFERIKRAVKPDGKSKISVEIPYILSSKFVEICGKPIEKAIKACGKAGVSFSNGFLVLKHEVVISLFQPVIQNIILHVKSLMQIPAMAKCSYFILVGGFGESSFLQEAISNNFKSRVTILVPEEAQMSVIKGAVLFGHNPDEIHVRIVRKTYGTDIADIFDPEKHDPKHKTMIAGVESCQNIFAKFVSRNTEVEVGQSFKNSFVPSVTGQTAMGFEVFAADTDEVTYVDDAGVEKVGSFTLQMPNVAKGLDRSVQAEITFGGTEIQIKATDLSSGETAETLVDFLF